MRGDSGGDVVSIGDAEELVRSDGLLLDLTLSDSSSALTVVEDVSIDNLSDPIGN